MYRHSLALWPKRSCFGSLTSVKGTMMPLIKCQSREPGTRQVNVPYVVTNSTFIVAAAVVLG